MQIHNDDDDTISGASGIVNLISSKDETDEWKLDLTPERHEDETLDEYHERQRRNKQKLKRHTLSQMSDGDNRKARRKKARKVKIRMTKPIKSIRNGRKFIMGEFDVTNVVKQGNDVLAYVKQQYQDARDLIDEMEDTAWERERGDIKIWED